MTRPIPDLRIFVPFIDAPMAERFFRKNPMLDGIDVDLIDNRKRGAGIPVLYNEIIDAHLDADLWLFFLHEDFEIKAPLPDLSWLPREVVYGTFGMRMEGHVPMAYGRNTVSHKDGSLPKVVGAEITAPTWVDTIDCHSILLHTSLLRRYPGLRFDEGLTFDLYAEELCLTAQGEFGLPVKVLPVDFQHYSYGRVTERYFRGLAHLAERHPTVGLPGTASFVGGRSKDLEAFYLYDNKANPAAGREG